jgi:S-methylmethionine-dependent homocysteine/selenocysteine methylase
MTTPRYRHALPQLSGQPMLTDSGLETTLIFLEGLDLPCFASFALLRSEDGKARLRPYFDRHAELAVSRGLGFIADTPTWRASRDWGDRLGFTAEGLDAANRAAVAMMVDLRAMWERPGTPVVISGNIGPRGDGYSPDRVMEADEAEAYHTAQVRSLAMAGVDMITTMTMTHAGEAVGVARASRTAGVPVSMGLTVETDGRLPTCQPLSEAIEEIDACGAAPAYYMINCAHPDHFRDVLEAGGSWRERIRAVRANASRKSHAELDESTELDAGDPGGLGQDYAALRKLLPNLSVFGGCCGTDHRHIAAMADACVGRVAA